MKTVVLILSFFFIAGISLSAEIEGEYSYDIRGKGHGFEIFEVLLNKEFFTNPGVEIFKPDLAWTSIAERTSVGNEYFVISFSTLTHKKGRELHFRVYFDILPTPEQYVFIDVTRARVKMTWTGVKKMTADYGEAVFFKTKNYSSPKKQSILSTTWGAIKK